MIDLRSDTVTQPSAAMQGEEDPGLREEDSVSREEDSVPEYGV